MQMQSTSSNGSVPSPAFTKSRCPLYNYVKIFEKCNNGGGNFSWECNLCGLKKTSSFTRMKSHLLKLGGGIRACVKVTPEMLAEMNKQLAEAKMQVKAKVPKYVPLLPSNRTRLASELYSGGGGGSDASAKKMKEGSSQTGSLENDFQLQAHDKLHAIIARYFFASGLPFHLAKNPWWQESYVFACNNPLAGYVPPSCETLRTTLLDNEVARVKRRLEPIKSTWKEKGVSIVCDGWSDTQRRPLINFIAVTESGPMFLKAVDCSGEVKDGFFIFELLKEVIIEVGPQNVVQVITDDARNCSSAGLLIEAEFPHIFWTPCVVHTLNLALQNICAAKNVENNQEVYGLCSWITQIAADANMIKNFIMNHGMRLAMFNKYPPLKLLSVATTRFASVLVMLKRLKLLKTSIGQMVCSDEWDDYRDDDPIEASMVKRKVAEDKWWAKIDYLLSFTNPIYDMLRSCDTYKPCLHLVYDKWVTMIEKVKQAIYKKENRQLTEESEFFNVIHAILVNRWSKTNTPLHYLAHSLNPRYYSPIWLSEGPGRKAPHRDHEVSKERNKCLKKYFPNFEERSEALIEFADFSTMSGDFNDSDSIEQRYSLDPKHWWVTYGAFAPRLQSLALRLLSQPSSSSCAENNWSTYSFIHSLKRNKLTTTRAGDLINLHSHLRLLSRSTPEYKSGASKGWDIGGDNFGSLDGFGELEFANLTLDEPELENAILEDGNEGGSNPTLMLIEL